MQQINPISSYRRNKLTLKKIDSQRIAIENNDGEIEYYVKDSRFPSETGRPTANINPRRKLKPNNVSRY